MEMNKILIHNKIYKNAKILHIIKKRKHSCKFKIARKKIASKKVQFWKKLDSVLKRKKSSYQLIWVQAKLNTTTHSHNIKWNKNNT